MRRPETKSSGKHRPEQRHTRCTPRAIAADLRLVAIMTSVVTGTTRTFTSTDDINKEIIDARVFAGIHTRTADVEGVVMGKKVGRYVARNFFRPVE